MINAFKIHIKSLSLFSTKEALQITVAVLGRKIESIASKYNLFAKTRFDYYQQRSIEVIKLKNRNQLSFISKFSGKKLFFSIRRNTTDIVIFDEILLNGGYWPVINLCKENKIKPVSIVDAGANIGSSVVFFKDVFPDAMIICIEPENKNFAQLKENVLLNQFNDINFINGGLWHKDEFLNLNSDFRGDREKELSFSLTSEADANISNSKIEGHTINKIMKQYNLMEIDLLKIDIEGAESFLFETLEKTIDILKRVKLLAIELHDESIDRFKFTKFVEEAGYRQITFGEVTYIYKPENL